MVGHPDDHGPASQWRWAVDPGTEGRATAFTVLEERCAIGDRIPRHRHDVDELVIVLSGEGTYSLGGTSHGVHEGHVADRNTGWRESGRRRRSDATPASR